jgi:hypothetical protein
MAGARNASIASDHSVPRPSSRRRLSSYKPSAANGADQREAGHQREQEREEVVAEGEPGEEDPDHRVHQHHENRVGRHRPEVVEALPERVPQVLGADAAHDGLREGPG